MSGRPKISNLLERLWRSLREGRYRYSDHANVRMGERRVTRPEVRQVLEGGHHEARKDEFDDEHGVWNYAIKGKTVDRRLIRVAVAFEESDDFVVITVIDVTPKRGSKR